MLLSDEGRAATFADILHSELDAFDDGSGERIKLSGPRVDLPSRLAVSLGMAVHELTTNAAKYGALSVYGGKVAVAWTVVIDAERHTLNIDWVESGGPPVARTDAAGLRRAPAGFRAARADPGQDQDRIPAGWRARALRGADTGGCHRLARNGAALLKKAVRGRARKQSLTICQSAPAYHGCGEPTRRVAYPPMTFAVRRCAPRGYA